MDLIDPSTIYGSPSFGRMLWLNPQQMPPKNYGDFLIEAVKRYIAVIQSQGWAAQPRMALSSSVRTFNEPPILHAMQPRLEGVEITVDDYQAQLSRVNDLVPSDFEEVCSQGSDRQRRSIDFILHLTEEPQLTGITLDIRNFNVRSRSRPGDWFASNWFASINLFSRYERGPIGPLAALVLGLEEKVRDNFTVDGLPATTITYNG